MSSPDAAISWLVLLFALALAGLMAAWLHAKRLRTRNTDLARLADQRSRALEYALREAEAASAAKGEFLAVMSHELRTPVHAILGMTELLMDSGLAREQRESAQTIQRAGRSLLGLLNDVLDFSKIEAGKLSLRSVPFDLRELVEDLADLHAVGALEKNLELVLHWDAPEERCLLGDPDRLRQVLMNLLGNALKFTARGHVVLRVSAPPPFEGQLRLRVEVEDTGPGISREKQGRLFESFSQEDTSITRRYGGTGLGLAISKRLVEGMGGRIGLDSEPGRGSVFWFTLKLPVTEEPTGAPAGWTGREFRVLVLDPLAESRQALAVRLRRWGLPCQGCGSLEEARTQGGEWDLILLDERLDTDPGSLGAPCVLLCPMHESRDAGRLRRLGYRGLLRKPVLAWDLRELLDRAAAGGSWFHEEEGHTDPGLPPRMAPFRVLLAEDNPLHQQVARRLLESLGAEVTLARDGHEAVALAERGDFEVVLMDGQMPGLDGLGAARKLREAGSRAPILAMTAHALAGDRERFLSAGMDAFLPKPFGRAELLEALQGLSPAWEGTGSRPPLDREALRRDEAQAPGSVRELLALYCVHAPCRLEAVRRALAEGHPEAAAEAVHALAGSAACIQAEPLAASARRLEGLLRTGGPEGAREALGGLEGEYQRVWKELESVATDIWSPFTRRETVP